MNRIKIKLLLFSTIILGFASCYSDNGNYDYDKINKVEVVSGLEEEYEGYYRLSTIEINPTIVSDDKSIEFDYVWGIYPNNASGYIPKLDTLALSRELTYFVDKPVGSYTLFLCATEKQTNISHYYKSKLVVVTEFTDGWYVLKDNGTVTDLDLFKAVEEKVFSYHDVLPRKLMGKSVSLSTNTKYDYMNEDRVKQTKKTVFFIQSEQELNVNLIADLSVIKEYETIFNILPESTPKQITYASCGTSYCISDEKGVYKNSTVSPNVGVFGYPLVSEHGNYRTGKYSMRNGTNVVVYDESNCRLLSIPYNGNNIISFSDRNTDNELLEYTPNNMNANCLYLSFFEQSAYKNGFGVFEDRTTKQRSVYQFNAKEFSTYKNPILEVTQIPTDLEMSSASLYAINHGYELMYYVKDNTIGVYNIDANSEETAILVYEPGTKITFINNAFHYNHLKPEICWSKFAVATYKDGRYKIYLYEINAGKPMGTPIIFEGEGRPTEVVRVAPGITNTNSSDK